MRTHRMGEWQDTIIASKQSSDITQVASNVLAAGYQAPDVYGDREDGFEVVE